MNLAARPFISFVIPCFNEEAAIPFVMPKLQNVMASHQFKEYFSAAEVLIVDDASTDQTATMLKTFTGIKVVRNESNLGYGASLKRGFSLAQGEIIAFLDMDDSYDPEDLCSLFEEMQSKNLDMVFGNRLNAKNGMPFIRGIGNYFFSYLIGLLFEQKITDVCTGYRLFKKELIQEAVEIPSNDLNYSIDLTLRMLLHKKNISQVPIRYHDRKGHSKLNAITDGFAFLGIILTHFFKIRMTSK